MKVRNNYESDMNDKWNAYLEIVFLISNHCYRKGKGTCQ